MLVIQFAYEFCFSLNDLSKEMEQWKRRVVVFVNMGIQFVYLRLSSIQ